MQSYSVADFRRPSGAEILRILVHFAGVWRLHGRFFITNNNRNI